ncbi:hypothetical protein H6G74_25405 [Nostoc spongiaeforme FACHB-130]|uniref:Uncharacterized protein n=1 Tax=Nostoc spongiaeforme FACHB-130 TaxID=1357510 RepID=A0ABR8G309_9NOSO|nr:hypothetical protein [Nostoc spongiaeforme]MBD2597635.1 hypothetical protein [Nostoc spongiaeforme FACHB-130]
MTAHSKGKNSSLQNLDNLINTAIFGITHCRGRDWRSTAPKPTNGRLQDLGSIPNGSICFDFD